MKLLKCLVTFLKTKSKESHWSPDQTCCKLFVFLLFSIKAEVKRISRLWRSDLTSGLEVATFWVERVMRTRGSKRLQHLKIKDDHLYWWQFYSLDVIFILLVALLALAWLTKLIFKKGSKLNVESVKKLQ